MFVDDREMSYGREMKQIEIYVVDRMRGPGGTSACDVVRARMVAVEWWDGIVRMKLGTETASG